MRLRDDAAAGVSIGADRRDATGIGGRGPRVSRHRGGQSTIG